LIRTGFRLVIELRYFSVTLPKLNVLRKLGSSFGKNWDGRKRTDPKD
jgi:hypothetical protein